MNCEQVMANEIAERYLLGRLSEEERVAYEEHFFACDRCLQELETFRAMRTELARTAPTSARETGAAQKATFRGFRWAWAAALAMLVIVGAVLILRKPSTAPQPNAVSGTAPVTAPPLPTPPQPGRDTLIAQLSRVEPPRYHPPVLRGPEDEAGGYFRAGMQRYNAGDYAGAASKLAAATRLNPQNGDARFFLGVSFLMTGQPDAAIRELQAATRAGAIAEPAHFFLAKAYLQKRDTAQAERELRKTIALHGHHEQEARRILGVLHTAESPAGS